MSVQPLLELTIRPVESFNPDSLLAREENEKIDDHTYIMNIVIGSKTVKAKVHFTPLARQERNFREFDPEGKLSALVRNGKIKNIEGTATTNDADVIFLSDTDHLDQTQRKIRGAIANILTHDTKEHVFLCEVYGPDKIFFNERERQRAFPSNLTPDGIANYYSGWDDPYLHKRSLRDTRLVLHPSSIMRKERSQLTIDDLQAIESMSTVVKSILEDSHNRTKACWESISQYRSIYPNARIFLFGGEEHFQENWIKEKLHESETKYCIITPRKEPKTESSENEIEQLAGYYAADEYGLFQ